MCVLACKAQFGDGFAAVLTEQAGGVKFAPIGSLVKGLVSYLCAHYSFILSISHSFVPFSHLLNLGNAIARRSS